MADLYMYLLLTVLYERLYGLQTSTDCVADNKQKTIFAFFSFCPFILFVWALGEVL